MIVCHVLTNFKSHHVLIVAQMVIMIIILHVPNVTLLVSLVMDQMIMNVCLVQTFYKIIVAYPIVTPIIISHQEIVSLAIITV